jgi:hypothetical protein
LQHRTDQPVNDRVGSVLTSTAVQHFVIHRT